MQRRPQLKRHFAQLQPETQGQPGAGQLRRRLKQEARRKPQQHRVKSKAQEKQQQHRAERARFLAAQKQAATCQGHQQCDPDTDDKKNVGAGSRQRHLTDAMQVADDAKLAGVIVDDGQGVGRSANGVEVTKAQLHPKPAEHIKHRQRVRSAVQQRHHRRGQKQESERSLPQRIAHLA